MRNHFIKAIMGGVVISFGAIIYLSLADDHVMGAFLFTLGIFTIYSFGMNLYTGKVCFIPNKKPSYLIVVAVTYVGNAVGTVGMALLIRQTKLAKLVPAVEEIVAGKLGDTPGSTFLMAIFCGIMICISVMGYITLKDSIARHLALTLPIMVFLLSGFEHSIADLFYFTLAGVWGLKAVGYSVIIALGNMIGGLLLPLIVRLTEKTRMGCE